MARLRLATLNLEDFGRRHGHHLPLAQRLAALRPLLGRLDADILCLQEVNAQRDPAAPERSFADLDRLLAGTPYAGYARAHAGGTAGGTSAAPADIHNLVTLSRLPITAQRAVRHDYVAAPAWQPATAEPAQPLRAEWDRPILHTRHAGPGGTLHVVNLHLRAPLAAIIPGQKLDAARWRSVPGWAEGFYVAAMKRTGQALEARLLVDRRFDAEPGCRIAVCGDFNAELTETPLRAVRGAVEDTGNPVLAGRALEPVETLAPEATRYSVLHAGRRALIDHVLVSVELRRAFVRAEVLSAGLADEVEAPARGETVAGSFHAPVVVEFDL